MHVTTKFLPSGFMDAGDQPVLKSSKSGMCEGWLSFACDEDVCKIVRAVSLQGLNPATPSKKYGLEP